MCIRSFCYLTNTQKITVELHAALWVTGWPADVGDVSSGVALDLLGDQGQIDVGRHLHLPQADPQQFGTALRWGTD